MTTELAVTSGGGAITTLNSGSGVTLTATVMAGISPVTTGQVKLCDATAADCEDIHIVGTAQLLKAETATFKFRPGVGSQSYKAVLPGTNSNPAGTSDTATLTSPAPGSTLPGSSVAFTWMAAAGVKEYQLELGTTTVGSSNLYNSGPTTATTETVSLPAYGVTVFARLWWEIGITWASADYTYTEAGSPALPVLTTPTPGSTMSGSIVAFTWTNGAGPAAYQLYLGTTGVGSHNLYESGITTGTSETVSGLPSNGAILYARLWWEIDAVWQSADYTYTEAPSSEPPALVSPAPGSVLPGSTVAFTWTASAGVTEYELEMGTTTLGSSNLYNSGHTTAGTTTASGLPTNGVIVYARLWWEIGITWYSADYSYTEAGTPVLPVLTSPTPGSTLSGSTVAFTWTTGAGPAAYQLDLGTSGEGSNNLYESGITTGTTETVNGVPTYGATVYAQLWWEINSVWQSAEYTYYTIVLPAAAPAFLPPAGTYTFAQSITLIDSTTRASIYYTLDGTNPTTGSARYSAPINIFATTTIKAIAAAPGFSTSAIASGPYTIVLPDDIVCWGDSMTAGGEGVVDYGEYPALLQQEVTPTVFNQGVSGETSTQIGVRQGGIPTYVAVMGGSIPAYGDGGVTITFPTGYEPLTDYTHTVSGSILGVEGELTLSAYLPGGTFTFTRTSAGDSPVSAPGAPQYIPITPYSRYVSIFWEGRNNLFPTAAGPWGQAQIVSDIAAQVAALPAGQNYLVLSVANEDTPEELSNGSRYSTITGLNSTLSSIYGNYYLDIRSILVNSYNPSLPTDVSDNLNDVAPTSLRAISAQGTLGENIGTADTSFSVNVTAGTLAFGEILTIDSENIRILEVSGSTVTSATRGYGGTLAPHLAGAALSASDPTHLNKQGYAVVANAIAAKLAALSGSAIYDKPDSTKPATIVSREATPR